jgi:Ca2+-binding RTX toxin-like protein
MSTTTIPYFTPLTAYEMATAPHLPLTAYDEHNYENAAQYTANYAGAAGDAVFSFNAIAGAMYSLSSTSYKDPGVLLVFDDHGRAIVEDDLTGGWGYDHLTFVAPYTGTYYADASWWQGGGWGQQAVTLSIYEDLATLQGNDIDGSSAGNDINGTSGDDNIFGYGGRDSLFGGSGFDYLDGGTGLDEAFYNGNRDEYAVRVDGDRLVVTDLVGNDGKDLLSNIERLDFKDIDVAFDINGAAGEAYRLYQAAFNRAPDLEGLGYWINRLDAGMSLVDVASGFVNSPEFRTLYGAQPSNYDVLMRLYQNILHRAPDAEGFNWWLDVLNTGKASLASVLVGFSESEENYAALVGTMQNGIEFEAWA